MTTRGICGSGNDSNLESFPVHKPPSWSLVMTVVVVVMTVITTTTSNLWLKSPTTTRLVCGWNHHLVMTAGLTSDFACRAAGLVLPQFPGLVISMTRATWLRDFWTCGLACARLHLRSPGASSGINPPNDGDFLINPLLPYITGLHFFC